MMIRKFFPLIFLPAIALASLNITPKNGVTSVGLSDGSSTPIYSISNSPVISSGTLTFSLNTKSANTCFAGPTSGGSAQPGFRSLVFADIPSSSTDLTGTTIVSRLNGTTSVGTLGIGNSAPISILEIGGNFSGTPSSTTAASFLIDPITFTDVSTGTGGVASAANMVFITQGTLSALNTTVTTSQASSLRIQGSVSAGTNETLTNSAGLFIGGAALAGTVTNSYAIRAAAGSGAANNYAAAFTGGNFGIGITTPSALFSVGAASAFQVNMAGQAIATALSDTALNASGPVFTTTAGTLTSTGTVPIANGGTGVVTVGTAPTASAWAGWDSNKDLNAVKVIPELTSTASSGALITLTVASNQFQLLTGSSTGTFKLPVATTLANGMSFTIINSSSAAALVETSGANVMQSMASNTQLIATCINTAGGTGTASWQWTYLSNNTGLPLTNPMNTGGDIIAGGAAGVPTRVANGTLGQFLQSSGGTSLPVWASPFQFYTSSAVTTTSSAVTGTTFTTFSNSPALSFTPTITGTYKVYSSCAAQATGGSSSGGILRIFNTTGSATLLAESGATFFTISSNNSVAAPFYQSVYTLTASTAYVFDIQGAVPSAFSGTNISLSGAQESCYMFAERVQ